MEIKFDKPSSYGRLMQKSFTLYSSCSKSIFLLALLLSAIIFIPSIVSYQIGMNVFNEAAGYSSVQLWLVFIDLAAIVFLIAIFYHLNCELGHKPDHIKDDIKVGIYRVIFVFAAAIVQTIIIFGTGLAIYKTLMFLYDYNLINVTTWLGSFGFAVLFALQTLLMLYVYTLFIFYLPIISVENRAVFHALFKSAKLAWNHWWRVFSLQISPWFVYFCALLMLQAMGLNIHIYLVDKNNSTLIALIVNIVVFALYIPWFASLLLVQLKDLELRYKLKNGK